MQSRRLVLIFGWLTAIFAAGYGVMFTMLDNFRDTYGVPASALGAIVAVGFFSSFGAQVFFGPLADRGHARRLVYLGMILNVIGLAGMAVGKSTIVLLAARLIMGLGAGMATPALRRIVILADPQHLGHNIGRLLAAEVAGFAAGPAVSAVLTGPFGIPAPFLVIAAVTVASFPLIARVRVDESARSDNEERARFAFDLLRNRAYVGALCFGMAVFVMVGTFDALWVLVLDDLKTASWIANLGISLFALPLIVLGSLGGRLAQRIGPFRLGTIGLGAGAAFMFAYGRLPTGLAMFWVSMVHALNDGVTVSSSGVAAALVAPPDRQAGAQGLLGGAQTLIGGVASLLAAYLYQHYGRATAYTTSSLMMVALVIVGLWSVGRNWAARPSDAPDRQPISIV